MNKSFYISFFLILIAGLFILSGCSATTSTSRYKEKKDEQNDKYVGRYDNKDEIGVDDTSCINDDEEELEDYSGDKIKVDISQIMKKYSGEVKGTELGTPQEKMLMEIIRYLDTPYKYGGNSKNGIDCSAFTQTVFKNCFNITLLRSARDQYTQGLIVDDKDGLKMGDLVFFNTRRRVRPGHVGIYIGDNLFAHASSSYGVRISSLEEDYYSKRFMGGRRIEESPLSN